MLALVVSMISSACAASSLTLGAILPGWEKVDRGSLHEAATNLARSYARQVGRTCTLPEVFLRDGTSSILIAKIYYEAYLPYGAHESVLLENLDQRVAIVDRQFGSSVLSVMVALDSTTLLVLCQ